MQKGNTYSAQGKALFHPNAIPHTHIKAIPLNIAKPIGTNESNRLFEVQSTTSELQTFRSQATHLSIVSVALDLSLPPNTSRTDNQDIPLVTPRTGRHASAIALDLSLPSNTARTNNPCTPPEQVNPTSTFKTDIPLGNTSGNSLELELNDSPRENTDHELDSDSHLMRSRSSSEIYDEPPERQADLPAPGNVLESSKFVL